MSRQRIVKYPPDKPGQLSKAKIERAVEKVLKARGVQVEPKRDTYRYHLKQGNKIIRSGITNDIERREKEHQRKYGNGVHVQQVGNRTTRIAATDWKKKQSRGTS